MYTVGGYFWIYVYVFLAVHFTNREFSKVQFKFFSGVSMYAYICHYMWIVIIAHFVIIPCKFSFGVSTLILIVGTTTGICTSYIGLTSLTKFLCPPKKKREQVNKTN